MPEIEASRTPRKRSRWIVVSAVVAVVVVVATAAFVSWLSTPAALEFALDRIVAQTQGKLAIEGLEGTLIGPLKAKRLSWHDEGTNVVADDVTIDHMPRALIGGRLVVRTLTARHLAVTLADTGSGEPVRLPESLALPIDLDIERVQVDAIDVTTGEKTTRLTDVSFGLVSDRAAHQIRSLRLHGEGATLTGTASVGTSRPFATSGAASLSLDKPRPEGRVDAKFEGSLESLEVTARSDIAAIVAEGRARLAPFAEQPFVEGRGSARDIDLARFNREWPTSRLAVDFEALPAPGGYRGQLVVENSAAGPVDANRLPLARVDARYLLAGRTFSLSDLAARLHGGGALAGSGDLDLDTMQSRWKLALRNVDLKSVHTSLAATSLGGQIEADVDEKVQRVVGDVAQPDLRLAFSMRYDGERLEVERALAQARGGTLEGKGRFDANGSKAFIVDARATRFDPSRFGAFPAGSIDGIVSAKGVVEPRLAADVDASIARGSRLAGLAADGRLRGRVTPSSASGLDVDVTLGANRLQASGAYGRTGDRLQFNLAAKRLAELVALAPTRAPKPLSGALQARGTLEQRERGARFDVVARGSELVVGNELRAASIDVTGGALHDAALTAPRLDALRDVALKVDVANAVLPQGMLSQATLVVNGSPAAHDLTLSARTPDASADVAVSASLSGAMNAPVWRGRATKLQVRGAPVLSVATLDAPATFEVARERVVIGTFRITGSTTTIESDGVDYRDGALATRGRYTGLPVAPLLKKAGVDERWPVDLVVGGAWDVTSRPAWRGALSVRRERGDVYVDDPGADTTKKLGLGIETLALDAKLDGRRVAGRAELQAKVGGSATSEFELVAPAGQEHPFTSASAVRATLRAQVPSLAALQPWIGTAARVRGKASADVAIAGTLDKPLFTGKVAATDLAYDMPQYGIALREGVLRASSTGDGVKLDELAFRSGDGIFTASGTIGLPRDNGATTPSRIEWRAKDFRLLNRPELRLVADGEGTLGYEAKRVVLRGRVAIDEGYIEYQPRDDTKLASDIVVVGRPRPGGEVREGGVAGDLPLDLDLAIELGRNLRFYGEGLDARLAGRVQITSKGSGPILAKGTIRTQPGGRFTAFGQKLEIDRARVIFDGPVTNPALDVVALRKNQAVEAGVEITGNVRAPLVRLTSNPPVPDNEKLSWLITGGPAGSQTARESAALSAAMAALSGRGGRPLSQRVAERVGLDDIGLSRREGASASDPVGAQVLTLGKRLTDRVYVAFEQGISAASAAIRIEYIISRYFTVSAFAGTESGVALSFRRNWP